MIMEVFDEGTEALLDLVTEPYDRNSRMNDVPHAEETEMSDTNGAVAKAPRKRAAKQTTAKNPFDGLTHEWVMMDRAMALDWVDQNKNNRKLRVSRVKQHAGAMLSGVWTPSNDMLCFDTKGRLINGQHRLEGFLLATEEDPDLTIPIGVVRGMPTKSFDNMDQVLPRSLADMFERQKKDFPVELGGSIRLLWLRLNSTSVSRGGGLRHDVANQIIKEHSGLLDAVQTVCNLNEEQEGMLRTLVSLPYMAALLYLMRQVDEKKADQFVTLLTTGEGLGKGQALHYLRNQLIKNRGAQRKLTRDAIVGLIIKTWNMFKDGEETKRLVLGEDEFPRIGGLDAVEEVEVDELVEA